MPRAEKQKYYVTLGIDLGSVSTRVFIWCPSTGVEISVINPSKLNSLRRSARHAIADFPSSCCPFDDKGPVYPSVDTRPDPERRCTSLKFAPYILVDCSDVLLRQYLLFEPLMERRHDTAFRARLHRGLEDLFSTIASQVDEICRRKGLIVADIALTVPSQWTLEFEDLYADIVGKVFDRPHSAIYFCTETEALANFVLRDNLDDLILDRHSSHDTMLFLDFGGHNMNGCIFEVVTGRDGGKSFYRVGRPFGAGGGSEQWEHDIGRLCDDVLELQHKISMTPRRKQEILEFFSQKKVEFGPGVGNQDTLLVITENNKKSWDVILKKVKVDKAWEEAHREPLKLAARRINELSGLTSKKGRVIVSGGTGQHPALEDRLKTMCREASLPEPFFTARLDFDPTYGSVKIAKGATYAVGSRITTEEFFQRGASIGLQIKQGTNNPEGLWNDTAMFLASIDHQPKTQEITRKDGAVEIQLVCDPFFSTAKNQDTLHHTRCYILLPLGKLPTGAWRISAKLEGQANDMVLVLERSRKVGKRCRKLRYTNRPPGWTQPFEWKTVETRHLPLYFDAGGNCVHVGLRGRDLRELGLGLPVEVMDETDEAEGTDDGDESGAEEKSVEGGQVPRREMETVYISGYLLAQFGERPQGTKPSGSLRHLERVDPLERRKTPSWKGTDSGSSLC